MFALNERHFVVTGNPLSSEKVLSHGNNGAYKANSTARAEMPRTPVFRQPMVSSLGTADESCSGFVPYGSIMALCARELQSSPLCGERFERCSNTNSGKRLIVLLSFDSERTWTHNAFRVNRRPVAILPSSNAQPMTRLEEGDSNHERLP